MTTVTFVALMSAALTNSGMQTAVLLMITYNCYHLKHLYKSQVGGGEW